MDVRITYALPVILGLVVLFAFPLTKHMTRADDRRKYYLVQACTFAGALAGAKLMAVVGDLGWPLHPVEGGWRTVLASGRSIVGGLLGGVLTAEVAKPLFDYHLPPNDRFAAVLPFSVAIGRVGCLLTGCCQGVAHGGWFSMRDAQGVPRVPTQLLELVFQVVTGCVFLWMVRRGALHGRLFALYLMTYGAFRFATEFVRDTPKWLAPLSAYQAGALVMIVAGASLLYWRTPRFRASSPAGAAAP